jgi:DNA polymerase-3 subunit delta'
LIFDILPMSLKEIFCQDNAIAALERAYTCGRGAHAYIFAGPDGIGKFKTACEWAKLLLCKNPTMTKIRSLDFADSCGRCESCQAFDADSHPDFNHIYKELLEFTQDGKGKTTPTELPIDVIREFLIKKAFIKPMLSNGKVFVVSEAEKLNPSSQNAMLKVLEEPPPRCCIILLCTRLEALLPTTKSRCQIIRFGPIDEIAIVERLTEIGLEHTKAQYFARLSQGSLGTACRLAQLEQAGAKIYQTKKELLEAVVACRLPDVLDLAQQFTERSKGIAAVWTELDQTTSKADLARTAQKTLIHVIISALQDALRLGVNPNDTLVNSDQKDRIVELARRFDPEGAAEKITQCYQALRWIEAAVNERLIFEHLLLDLTNSDIIAHSL